MDDTPAASATTPDPDPTDGGPSRRWFLLGGGALVLVGAATGTAVRLARADGSDTAPPDPAPAELTNALARERQLIADLDASTGGDATVRALIAGTRRDHVAHAATLQQLLARYTAPGGTVTPSGSAAPTVPAGTPRTVTELRAAETAASTACARAAERSSGRTATVLASICASEASHAEVLR